MRKIQYEVMRIPRTAQAQLLRPVRPTDGRTAIYRRLQRLHTTNLRSFPFLSSSLSSSLQTYVQHIVSQKGYQTGLCSSSIRSFHQARILTQKTDSTHDESPRDKGSEHGPVNDSGREEAEASFGEGDKKSDQEDGKEQKEKEKGESAAPPPPHGDKSPWQVFRETLSSEFKASKEWNESTKALAAGAHQFTENESVKKAKQAYESTTGKVSTGTSKVLKSTAGAVGKGAAWTWETPVVKGVRTTVNVTADVIDRTTKPIRETEAFKNVKNVIDDGSSSRYGGWVEKEERRKARELRELQEARDEGGPRKRAEVAKEDPNAGTNVTLHKDSKLKETWKEFCESNRMMQGIFSMKSAYNDSDNPLISTARGISDRVAGFFAENEQARVIKKFREVDPSFQIEPFLRDMREYILPEILDAYVKGDTETLRLWLSAAQFSVYEALTKQYTAAGLKSDGRILDIRHVEILNARLLDPGDIPVFIITCRTQEVHVYRKLKTNELAAGMEDKVQLVTYAIGVTRIPEDVNNAETRGWRLIELQKSGRDYI